MNYRHAYHAGNFADVVKHVAMIAIIEYLKKKPKPFVVIDTHAGRGLYDLAGSEAAKTHEANDGIGKMRSAAELPDLLRSYVALTGAYEQTRYPGSPLIVANLLRECDRLIAIEKLLEEEKALQVALASFKKARCIAADGYELLRTLLPPAERRGLVLIDPPFEAEDEFAQASSAFQQAHRRFANGIYLLWFPVKSEAEANAFVGEILAGGAERLLRIDVSRNSMPSNDNRLQTAGLLVVNPPFGFAEAMTDVFPALATAMDAALNLTWLAKEAA